MQEYVRAFVYLVFEVIADTPRIAPAGLCQLFDWHVSITVLSAVIPAVSEEELQVSPSITIGSDDVACTTTVGGWVAAFWFALATAPVGFCVAA